MELCRKCQKGFIIEDSYFGISTCDNEKCDFTDDSVKKSRIFRRKLQTDIPTLLKLERMLNQFQD